MLKYKCSNNANHIFEKPTDDFWCSLCDISTKSMLIPFDEDDVLDVHITTKDQKEDKSEINVENHNIENTGDDKSTSTPNFEENNVNDKIVEQPTLEQITGEKTMVQDVQDELEEKKVTYEEISFGNQIWMKNFYSNTEFSNGDKITFAKNEKEWKKLNDKKTPSWTFASDSESSEKFGILYNFYAINNIAGLAPNGWRIPTIEDVKQLKNNFELTFVSEHIKRFNQTKVYHSLALGSKIEADKHRIFWTSNEKFYTAFSFVINEDNPNIEIKQFDKSAGFFVRCLKINKNESL